ncbi:hypothetical protein [Nonomuraea jiangxiensis]|uniref:Knr4/Smi1-like domain-containing protein n=1 Tax=Nonomuraea jiangxiensis TaxID=633440 RepID=A0A1G8R9U2_9ACTN|nr:hypothetical protein [Nonomuraea jiangxiensis]SDJ13814.1 hypothetical protein SAMN05421869_1098 [Nonomuraea jiangxiensis]
MLKLVRLALTAAVLTAIGIRLRRRARMPRAGVPAIPAQGRARSSGARMGLVWGGIAVIVAVTLVAALVPTRAQEEAEARWRAYQAEQDAMTAELLRSEAERPQASLPAPTGTPGVLPTGTPGASATGTPGALPTETPGVLPTETPGALPTETPGALAMGTPGVAGAETESPDPYCSPSPRPVTVRPIDPEVKRAVDRQWRRIERWLRENAPRTYRTLGAPGKARTIAVAESQMGVDFPDDLRASLLRHNGSHGAWAFGFGFGFDGAINLGTREIRDAWRWMCSWERTDFGTDPSIEHWNGRMIPYLDLRGDSEATPYGVVDSVTGEVGWHDGIGGMAPRHPSYYRLMRAVADALEQGTAIGDWRPTVKRGVLRWRMS